MMNLFRHNLNLEIEMLEADIYNIREKLHKEKDYIMRVRLKAFLTKSIEMKKRLLYLEKSIFGEKNYE